MNIKLITSASHKIKDRVGQVEADFRGKINHIDSAFKDFINETRQEFLHKPPPYFTKEETQALVDEGIQNNKEKGRKIFVHKGSTDFEVFHLRKHKHFTDHAGNYLTKTGLKIDDFNL